MSPEDWVTEESSQYTRHLVKIYQPNLTFCPVTSIQKKKEKNPYTNSINQYIITKNDKMFWKSFQTPRTQSFFSRDQFTCSHIYF